MKCGLHVHQFPAAREDKLSQLRVPIWTVLHMDLGYYQRFIAPGAEVIIRFYDPDVMGHPPEQWADRCHREMIQWQATMGGDPRRFICQGINEANLTVEHNNQGYAGQPWDSDIAWPIRRDWLLRFHRALRGFAPTYRVGGPWDSPGHQDVDGRQEVRLLAEAGFWDLVDVAGFHFYAEGPDRGGFDAPDRIYYSDRALVASQMLTQLGYPPSRLPRYIGECNRKQVDIGDPLAEWDRYLDRLEGEYAGCAWFIWSSGDPSFQDMALARIADRAPQLQAIIDKHLAAAPPPPPPPPPPAGIAWKGAFADWAAAHPEVGQPLADIAYVPEPGAWRCAAQAGKDWLLVWNGVKVIQIARDK